MTECKEREQTRKVKAKYFFSYTQILGEKKSISLSPSLSLAFFPCSVYIPTDGAGLLLKLLSAPSASLAPFVCARVGFHSTPSRRRRWCQSTHTHTAHSKGDEEKMDSLIFIQKKEYTDSSSSSMPVQAAKEEKKRLLGLAWPFTDFSLLLLELLFFTFASPWYRKEIEKPLKKEELSGHKSETNKKKRKEMKHQMRHKFDDDHFISLPFFPPVDFTCLFPWADENEAEGLIRQNINESREPSKARLTIKVLALQLDCCIAEAALAISFSAFHPESHSSPAPAVYYRDFCICCKDRCMLRIYNRRSLHVPVLFLLISLVCVFCAIQVALPCGV